MLSARDEEAILEVERGLFTRGGVASEGGGDLSEELRSRSSIAVLGLAFTEERAFERVLKRDEEGNEGGRYGEQVVSISRRRFVAWSVAGGGREGGRQDCGA